MGHLATEIVTDESQLRSLVDEMSALADRERLALGFWPKTALLEAISRRAVMALVRSDVRNERLIGYIHHSGTYPHAKIQQIAIKRDYRKSGHARALLNTLVSSLEKQGYLSIRADVAEDLPESLSFYRSNGFVQSFIKRGGKSRKRSILVHERPLETDDLFSISNRAEVIDLGIRRRSAGDSPLYAFDLNVYFDLVRDRGQSELARRIFGSALAHEVRLAVASEFAKELERTSAGVLNDPVLQLALRLPKLPNVDPQKHASVAEYVHDIVFVRTANKAAGTAQAKSDASHIAHAALARASGFITRDGSLLAARTTLLEALGIDIISTGELVGILPTGLRSESPHPVGQGFVLRALSQEELLNFLKISGVAENLFGDFSAELWVSQNTFCEGVIVDNEVVAAGVAISPRGTLRTANFLLFADPSFPKATLVCDYLLDRMITEVCGGKPVAIQLVNIPGQSIVGSVARSKGFSRSKMGDTYEKFVLGHPLTFANWGATVDELRRCTGLIIPREVNRWDIAESIEITFPSGARSRLTLGELDLLLGPTMVVSSSRPGVLVPIGRSFADELLGTSTQTQFAFVENRDAAFTSRRGYVSSPQRSALFQPDSPIMFYESMRSGGRGGVVAIAKIADSLIVRKSDLSNSIRKQLVVDEVESFSSSESVLVTSFDGLMKVPRPVSLRQLRQIGAVDGANLVSAKAIGAEQMDGIVGVGWGHSS